MKRKDEQSGDGQERRNGNKNFVATFRSGSANRLFASFHFLRSASITPRRSDWMQSRRKSFRLCKELLVRVAATRSFQPFESKFHRDGDFEIPVAIFILQVERYAVTTGTAVVRAIEQAELINNTFVN